MTCSPTQVPAADEIDMEAIRKRYAHERDRRLRADAGEQYVKTEREYAPLFEGDPHMPRAPRDPISEELDVAVLGGGFTGLQTAVHLRNAGISDFRIIEHGGDFGGVWYWNRYPGVQCDNDAYCYLPLLEETGYLPSRKFADGFEIQGHCRRIGKHFGLYEHALFHTRIHSLCWDGEIERWRIATDRGDEIRARFVIMCGGPLNRPKLPGIAGLRDFKGKVFHTARWDYDYTGGSWEKPELEKLRDKRVAIVGTGATSIQAVPALGRYARQLYVLQRTPATVDARPNPPTDPEWAKSLKPGWKKERQRNFHHTAIEGMGPGDTDLICDIWTEINRNLAAELAAEGWPELTFEQYMARREEMDFRVLERMRRRVDSIVRDKATAEALKPWFGFHCKRPLSNDDYYPTFNLPNVRLLDVADTRGVERMTGKGFVHHGVEYEIDCLICASGFEVTSDLDRRWGISAVQGRDGQSLYQHWADGFLTLHGAMTHGFPNQFFTGYLQGGFNATTVEQFSRQGYHAAHIIKAALDRGATTVEPTREAQNAWVAEIRATAVDISKLQSECTPGYFNNEGDHHQGRRWYLGESYGPGWDTFEALMQEWRETGALEGLTVKFSGSVPASVAEG